MCLDRKTQNAGKLKHKDRIWGKIKQDWEKMQSDFMGPYSYIGMFIYDVVWGNTHQTSN